MFISFVRDEIANDIRQTLLTEFKEKLEGTRQRCDRLTRDIDEKIENDDYFENDIRQFQSTLDASKQEIERIQIVPRLKHLRFVDETSDTRATNTLLLPNARLSFAEDTSDRLIIRLDDRQCTYMAASEQYLLAWTLNQDKQDARLVLYRVSDGTELASTPLDLESYKVNDIVYTESLDQCFLIVCAQHIFTYNPQTMSLSWVRNVKPIDDDEFWSIASSPHTNDVFLITSSNKSIGRWSREKHPQWRLIERWPVKDIIRESDRGIRMIRVCGDNEQVACSILQDDLSWRIDLFDLNFHLIRRGERIPVTGVSEQSKFASRLAIAKEKDRVIWFLTHVPSNCLWSIDGFRVHLVDHGIHTAYEVISTTKEKIFIVSFRDRPRSIEIYRFPS